MEDLKHTQERYRDQVLLTVQIEEATSQMNDNLTYWLNTSVDGS